MSRVLKDIPGWVQAVVAVVLFTVGGTSSCSMLQRNIDVEATERKASDEQLKQEDQHFRETVTEIKQMLREELDKHHPRQQ